MTRAFRLAAAFWCAVAAAAAARGAEPELRIAVSESIMGEMNSNDAGVAMRTWADAVARQTGLRFQPELCTSSQLIQKVRKNEVDAFSLNIFEFARVAAYAGPEVVVDASQLPGGDEYLLLVNRAGGIARLADLRGRSLLVQKNSRTCLAKIWLDTLLASARLERADAFLGRIEDSPKLSRVVLPVFFRQTDACLVTRLGYETLCQLNPQIGRELRPLAVSPKVVTTFLAFQKTNRPDVQRRFVAAVTHLQDTVAGQQVLMLFAGSRMVAVDSSVLASALDLLHAYQRIEGRTPDPGQ
ncbi:MAG TPA: PhnD/SsuA/transferrin family substrate-binding protein [Bryobacteraceae bacterium]|nr:PhnD/SsuA/transferrin family substrate-binding protein [Bryobacteraceae bacterium]